MSPYDGQTGFLVSSYRYGVYDEVDDIWDLDLTIIYDGASY